MNNKIFITLTIFATILFSCFGCKETSEISDAQNNQLNDSLSKAITTPSSSSVNVILNKEQTEMKIILVDPFLYAAPSDKKNEIAAKSAKIAVHIYGTECRVKIGKIIFTKETRNSTSATDPTDGIAVDLKIAEEKEQEEKILEEISKMHK